MWRALAAVVLLVTVACDRAPAAGVPPNHEIARRPPTSKDIIEAVLASHSVPLTVDASCAGVGAERDDATIGAYLSGFLAELSNPDHRNWIQTSVAPATSSAGDPVWRCELLIRHAAREDEWGWGVRFDVRQDSGQVLPDSFVCLGAG